jgi:hypothetical protein
MKRDKGKGIPTTGREGPQGSEALSLPYYLDNRFIDGGEVVSVTRQAISVKGRGGL